ncbi:hypothetical protein D1007_50501 [Hordeum vulgare]|nr:hypothetical protein D1007_50501 [Hordeum vulgare]
MIFFGQLNLDDEEFDDLVIEEEIPETNDRVHWMALARVHTNKNFSQSAFFKDMRVAWNPAQPVRFQTVDPPNWTRTDNREAGRGPGSVVAATLDTDLKDTACSPGKNQAASSEHAGQITLLPAAENMDEDKGVRKRVLFDGKTGSGQGFVTEPLLAITNGKGEDIQNSSPTSSSESMEGIGNFLDSAVWKQSYEIHGLGSTKDVTATGLLNPSIVARRIALRVMFPSEGNRHRGSKIYHVAAERCQKRTGLRYDPSEYFTPNRISESWLNCLQMRGHF